MVASSSTYIKHDSSLELGSVSYHNLVVCPTHACHDLNRRVLLCAPSASPITPLPPKLVTLGAESLFNTAVSLPTSIKSRPC